MTDLMPQKRDLFDIDTHTNATALISRKISVH